MSKYADIIKRLEEATGPDRGLDAIIWLETTEGATRVKTPVKSSTDAWPPYVIDETRDPAGRLITVQPYAASIDSAIALVVRMLPGWEWATGFDGTSYGAAVSYTGDFDFEAHAKTAPIAILLSIFKALDAKAGAA